jgi:Lrp/AsnC family leucine-responsive transcriptional regulator
LTCKSNEPQSAAMTDQLDRIDRNILAALSREGRLSSAELA